MTTNISSFLEPVRNKNRICRLRNPRNYMTLKTVNNNIIKAHMSNFGQVGLNRLFIQQSIECN